MFLSDANRFARLTPRLFSVEAVISAISAKGIAGPSTAVIVFNHDDVGLSSFPRPSSRPSPWRRVPTKSGTTTTRITTELVDLGRRQLLLLGIDDAPC